MSSSRSVAYISDQVFYDDGRIWYTSNGFPLEELIESVNGTIEKWTFFGRLLLVDSPPAGALPVCPPEGVQVAFVGPRLKKRGILGYLWSLREYIRLLRECIGSHDVLWIKANFVAAWLSVPLLVRSNACRISHQVGDPAQIAVGAPLLRPVIRAVATAMTRMVHRVTDINVFVSRQLSEAYGTGLREPWIYNESRLRLEQFTNLRALPARHRPVRLLYAGRLSPEKGILVLIEAIANLELDCELRLVGDGIQRGELERVSSRHGIRSKVHFLGAVSWGTELFNLMRESDILILPSYTEGLGLVLLEAMSQGLPVIASNVGGIPEIVHDEYTGLLFPPGDFLTLAKTITRLATDCKLRTRLRENALELARQNTLDNQLCGMFRRIFSWIESRPFTAGAESRAR